jgi:hypothetical protein
VIENEDVDYLSLSDVSLSDGFDIHKGIEACDAFCLADTPAVSLGRLLVIAVSFNVPYQAFLFAQLLKASHHLLDCFAGSRLYFKHTNLYSLAYRCL